MVIDIKEPTGEQKAVINTDRTAVVAAGAGSGKTTVLAHRFVRLVLEKKTRVDAILTLTFTNKATNEMRQRIYKFLAARREAAREGGEGGEDGSAEKALLDRAIADFYQARIETLDAYCASIVRAASSRYGLAPDFSEDMEKSEAIIKEESLPFVIKYRNHPAITELYREKTPDMIARDVFAETISKHCFLGNPVDFVADFHAAAQKIDEDWDALTAEIKRILREIRDRQTALAAEIRQKKCEPLDIPDIDFEGGPLTERSRMNIVTSVKTLYDFACTPLNRNPGKMLKDHFNALRDRLALFVPLAVFIMRKDGMEKLCGLLNEFENIVFDRKRREGALSYADAASLARKILLEDKVLRREEKENFSSIIIDEFQDNNALQRDILYLLAEKQGAEQDGVPDENNVIEGKLFFVGDEKQSIYKFRGADVSVFRELQSRFPSGHFTLQTNFRSSHSLIGFFNAVFGGTDYSETKDKLPASYPSVFAHTDTLPPYEAGYTPLQTSEAKKQVDGKAVVCLFPALGSRNKSENENEEDDAEHAETEAVFVAKKIRELKENGHYQYRDMAILVRSHTNEHFFEKHLRRQGIPYTNENLSASISIDPAADLYALLRLVSYPMDRLAYAEVLRSPFAGLTFGGMLSALKAYDQAKADGESPAPFAEAPGFLSEALSEEDLKKFDNGRKVYLAAKNRSINGSIKDLIAYLWYAQGYRYEVLWHHETRAYYNSYHFLFALAVKADNAGTSLALFTETLKKLLDRSDRPRFFSGAGSDKSWLDDLAVPYEKEDALSLMTIHKSKGLEFPVVFVCGCGDGRKKTESSFVVKNESGFLTITPGFPAEFSDFDPKKVKKNYFRENAKDEENAKERAELRRLLYVAMTRAEREIYLTGTLKYTKDDNDGVDLKTLVKSVAERKQEKKEPRIEGDTIIDNGNFLGLLLPMIAERMDEGLFELEEIPAAGREDIYGGARFNGSRKTGGIGNDAAGRALFIAKARAVYEKARIIDEEKTYPRHQSVTYLKKRRAEEAKKEGGKEAEETTGRYGHFEKRDALSGRDAADVFQNIDILLADDGPAGGGSPRGGLRADFGTITHACVEAALKHKSASIPPLIAGKLDGGTAEQLLAAGEEIARRFLSSPLGMMAQHAAWAISEFPFRMLEKNEKNAVSAGDISAAVSGAGTALGGERRHVFINGTMDLVFEKDGIVTIVDFKTDRTENPAEHAAQTAVYNRAARDLWQKETQVFLYYLRTGHVLNHRDDTPSVTT
jgi:ATP-dependent helicase/nuclease subunit A